MPTSGTDCSQKVNLACSFEVDSEKKDRDCLVIVDHESPLGCPVLDFVDVSWIRLVAMDSKLRKHWHVRSGYVFCRCCCDVIDVDMGK